jgi:hypothetical protein
MFSDAGSHWLMAECKAPAVYRSQSMASAAQADPTATLGTGRE